MTTPRAETWTRREFLDSLVLAGTAGFLGVGARPVAAEPPPETPKPTLLQDGTDWRFLTELKKELTG